MYLFVITTYNMLSNGEFKSKPYVHSSLSAARMDSTTPAPEPTLTSQGTHHERALSSSSNGNQTLVKPPNPEPPARSMPWMDGSKEYQPQQRTTAEPDFTEELWREELSDFGRRSFWCTPMFWRSCCSCTAIGPGPVGCCTTF